MTPVVGIDLGTTNTVVGVVKDGQAAALPDEAGERLIPSVVSFHPGGNVLVGRGGKERRLQDAKNTIYSIKRLIGRSWDSEEVRRARTRFPFEMREGPGQAALVVARGETYTLPEISAFVLRKAKAVAEAALGTTIERAVITVPANFNDLQRAATKVAGRVAGLEVLRILNEPTAAALAYGYGKSTTERLAVYDFGGGTFDVTLLDLSDNVFEVLATAGNTFLGGDDIDQAIADKMADEFLAVHRYDARTDPIVLERLRAAAETLKVQLSTENQARARIGEVAHGAGGRSLDLDFSITRAELERLLAPIADRTFDVCREALGIARLQPGDFDQVLLVGGSTRIPLVKKRVEEFFKRPALSHISPDEVVAIGAAIQASALSGAERRRANVPPPPRPAALDQGSQAPPPRARLDTNPFDVAPARPRIDTNPFGPNTQPFSRERLPTSPGIQPSGPVSRADAMAPTRPGAVIVQPPGGLPVERAPVTADQPRRRQTTGQGLGVPPPPMAPTAGARGRVRTGPGLGPRPPPAPVRTSAAPVAPPAATLLSAQDAALRALAAAAEQAGAPAAPDVAELSPAQIAEKYGKLPLVMPPVGPGTRPAPPPLRVEDDEPTETGLARSRQPSLPDVLAPPPPPPPPRTKAGTLVLGAAEVTKALTEESVSAFVVDDDELEPELTERVEALAPPITAMAVDDITIVRRNVAAIEDAELELPVPDVPDLEEDPSRPPAPATSAAAAAEFWDAPPVSFTPITGPLPQPPLAASSPARTVPMAPAPALPVQPAPAPPPWGAAPAAAAAPWERPAGPAPVPPAAPPFQAVAVAPSTFGTQPYATPAAPLLVDVTPLSLTVETVNGFCDTIIQRNTPVPCERTRDFVTAIDNQTSVRVRVSQGESGKFRENTLLGELELDGLRPAPRGSIQIKVSFALDSDGILNVSARDVASGRATSARVRLVGLPEAAHVEQMVARQQAHHVG